MSELKTPETFTQLDKKNIETIMPVVPEGKALFIFSDIGDSKLNIYGSPTEISHEDIYDFWINPKGNTKFDFYLRRDWSPLAGDSSLWNSFSKALVGLRLKAINEIDYNLKHGCIPSGSSGNYEGTYIVDVSNSNEFESIFDYTSRKMLSFVDSEFEGLETKKLEGFLLEDFTSRKHIQRSDKIAAQADAVFFPSP